MKDELNKEKNNNEILRNENKKLNDIINDMKIKNNDLNNKYELLEKQLKKLELELQCNKSNNIININNNNLFDLIRPLGTEEKIKSRYSICL